jgi:tRNA-2-methylthio-N6-dimethylallyladenosine synthase
MDQLPEAVKDERLQRLQREIERQQAAFMASCVGRTFDVLFDKPGRHPGQVVGRSPYLQPVPVIAPTSLIGEIAPVTITEVRTNSLFGVLANAGQQATASLAEAIGA